MRSLARAAAAIALGTTLGALPFLRYAGVGTSGVDAHQNHDARHGGQLAMVADHHVELVRDGTVVEVYVSDSSRQPVRPRSASVAFDDGAPERLEWEGYRMAGPDRSGAGNVAVRVDLGDGTVLAVTFATG